MAHPTTTEDQASVAHYRPAFCQELDCRLYTDAIESSPYYHILFV